MEKVNLDINSEKRDHNDNINHINIEFPIGTLNDLQI